MNICMFEHPVVSAANICVFNQDSNLGTKIQGKFLKENRLDIWS